MSKVIKAYDDYRNQVIDEVTQLLAEARNRLATFRASVSEDRKEKIIDDLFLHAGREMHKINDLRTDLKNNAYELWSNMLNELEKESHNG